MARLIDATRIEQFILNNCSDNEEINTIYGELINAPDIDLVRCGECKHRYMDKSVWLCVYGLMIKPNGFCNYGERRADDQLKG